MREARAEAAQAQAEIDALRVKVVQGNLENRQATAVEHAHMVEVHAALEQQGKLATEEHVVQMASARSSIDALEAALKAARDDATESAENASLATQALIADATTQAAMSEAATSEAEARAGALSSKLEMLGLAARDAMLEHEREMSAARKEVTEMRASLHAAEEAAAEAVGEAAEAETTAAAAVAAAVTSSSSDHNAAELIRVRADLSDAREATRVLESALEMEKRNGDEALKEALDAMRELEVRTQAKLSELTQSNEEYHATLKALEEEKRRAQDLAETLERERLEDRLHMEKRASSEISQAVEAATVDVTARIMEEMEARVSAALGQQKDALARASQAENDVRSAQGALGALEQQHQTVLQVCADASDVVLAARGRGGADEFYHYE